MPDQRRALTRAVAVGWAVLAFLPAGCRAKGPPAAELWREFSGPEAMKHVEAQVALGPRPAGSEALEKTRLYLEGELKRAGWTVERQTFAEDTPRGPIAFVNLIARFAKTSPAEPRVIVGSHYDTKWFRDAAFVGAVDGGSSTGALVELARVLGLRPALARRVELVLFDGEEASMNFTDFDGLHGSRHYGRLLRETGRAKQFKFGFVWDMIGDKSFGITLPTDSPKELVRGIFDSAETLGVRDKFAFLGGTVLDDHKPLNDAGIPTIDLIDFDFAAWHTLGDTIDKVAPKSLEITGQVTLHLLGRRAAEIE